ncbi:MAG: hypothetical protein AB1Z21_12910, partial [Synechococcaceae cyanobacterium]
MPPGPARPPQATGPVRRPPQVLMIKKDDPGSAEAPSAPAPAPQAAAPTAPPANPPVRADSQTDRAGTEDP